VEGKEKAADIEKGSTKAPAQKEKEAKNKSSTIAATRRKGKKK